MTYDTITTDGAAIRVASSGFFLDLSSCIIGAAHRALGSS